MGALDNVVTILEKWPVWKRVANAADQIEALEKRVADLENRLKRAPGEACPRCGELDYRVAESKPHRQFGDMGAVVRKMRCEKCAFEEDKLVVPETAGERKARR